MSAIAQGGKLLSGNTTLAKIYEVKESGTNGLLCKNGCEEEVVSILAVAVRELMGMADTNFTNDTIIDTAIMIANEYPHHRPQEAIVAIKNGIAGKYGKTYGKITTMEVMRWLKEYEETERTEFFEGKGKKSNNDWRLLDPELMKGILKTEKKVEQKVEREKTESEKLIQQWLIDFDKVAKQIGAGKFAEVVSEDGVELYLSVDEYLQYKLNTFNK